ncbi:MAG: PmoA family protein [Candidatus Zipacnadales bacterium]
MSSVGGFPEKLIIEVEAGHHDRRHCPISINLDYNLSADKALMLTDTGTGLEVPVTSYTPYGTTNFIVTFILDELPAGARKTFIGELVEAQSCCTASTEAGVSLTLLPGERVDITVLGQPFTSYVVKEGIARPYCYPVLGPGGIEMTNLGPADHIHHRSMYIAQGAVNGHDNWSEGLGHACTVNRTIEVGAQGPAMGALHAINDWVTADGQKLLEEQVYISTYAIPDEVRIMDWDITWTARYGGVFFGDTKEAGTLSVRVHEQLEGRHTGCITNAYGAVTERETWGQRAPWCDYSGEIKGRKVGLAIFDHPQNLRYPTYWHVRDYGLFTANQWGIHDFTGDWSQRGDYALPRGQSLRFRFRVYIHKGDVREGAVAERFHDWANPPAVSVQAKH